jgi:predicted HD superfamily hydrolase involved in NAD metabolism
MKALEKWPADRWQSAEEMLAQLEPLATPSGGLTPTSTTPTSTTPVPALAPVRSSRRRPPVWAMAAVAVLLVAAGGVALFRMAGRGAAAAAGAAAATGARAVAVLPFENVGGDSGNAAFTDGMQSEILTDLTRLGALQVTSRNSVQEYRKTTKSTRQIGAELGVQSLLQGQVQRAGNQVRVTVQLVDAPTDRQIWAESYDRELTAQNIFTIQGDIASNVAQALRASFSSSDVAATQKAPTANLEALDWYHRGQVIFANRGGDLSDTGATHAFGRAVALDSNFAGAWAGLAAAESWKVRNGTTTDTLPARVALDRAVALAPAASETKVAQAYYAYYARADFDGALALFKAVAAARPSDVDAVAGVGYIARRRGRWNEALAAERKLIELDPRSAGALSDMGYTYLATRRYGEDVEKARIAALLHDCARCLDSAEMRRLLGNRTEDTTLRALMHAPAGAALAKQKYGVEDNQILSAIRWHTTGHEGMTRLEKIVYLADFIEPNRPAYPGLAELREEAFRDLDRAVKLAAENTMRYVRSRGLKPDENTMKMLNGQKSTEEII